MKNKAVPSTKFKELRRQAEARLGELKRKTAPLPSLDINVRRLVHELEVYQVELEMQNDELMQVRAELEAAVYQLTDLYDLAPVGYFTLTRDGTIIRANLTGANLLGVERSKLLKHRFGHFISLKSRITFDAFLKRVSESQRKESCDLALLKGGHTTPWVRIEATCSEDGLDYRVIVLVPREKKRRKN
jgi:PAS domain-containing protein